MKICLCSIALVASFLTTGYCSSLQVLSSAASGAFSYKIGNGTYYSPASPIVDSCLEDKFYGPSRQLPLTVFRTNETRITADVLKNLVSTYASLDDVWTEEFLTAALVLSAPHGSVLDDSAGSWLTNLGIKYFFPSAGMEVSCLTSSVLEASFHPSSWNLQPGPYVLTVSPPGITIHQSYGL